MFRFVRDVLASTAGVLLAILVLLAALLASLPQSELPHVPDGAVLMLDCSYPFLDDPVPSSPSEWLAGDLGVSPVPLARVQEALRHAAEDERIAVLELTGSVAPMGWATLATLRRAVEEFKESGKPVMADFTWYDEAAVYLASAADRVDLPPLSDVEWNGFAAELLYYPRALEKAGIEVQVARVGDYKSAVEPYLTTEMSAANREQIEALLRAREGELLGAVAAGRKLDPEALRALFVAQGLLGAEEAVAAGLADGVRYHDEVSAALRRATDAYDDADDAEWGSAYDAVTLEEYVQAALPEPRRGRSGTVAVIYAEGEIVDWGGPGDIVGHLLALELEEARLDEDVAAVVLRISSPGGSARASEVVLREVELLAADKPVVVSMGDVAASGGYWIACGADEIYADAQTITGSIGVFGMYPNLAPLAERVGLDVQTVASSPHAAYGSWFQSLPPATMARLQARVDAVYQGFLDRVVAGRGLERDEVAGMAQGRVWTGEAARELGLIDALGGLDEAVDRAADLAGLEAGHPVEHRWYEPDEWERFLNELMRDFGGGWARLPAGAAALAAELHGSARAADPRRNPGRVWARLPWTMRVR